LRAASAEREAVGGETHLAFRGLEKLGDEMAKNSTEAYGARGKTNLLMFDPEDVVLVTDEKHPLYDERVHDPLDEAFVLNIMFHGVLEPIIVSKDRESDKVLVVVGRQRTKACREANKRLKLQGLPPILLPGTTRRGDDASLAGVMVSENEIRKDDSPITRSKKMARLLEMGRTEDDLAVIFGCSKSTVKNALAVLDCCAAVRSAVDDGKINVTAAYRLSKLDADDQKKTVDKMIAAGDGVKGKRQKSRAQKEAASGKSQGPSKKEIAEYRSDIAQRCADEEYRKAVLPVLDYVLGNRATAPKFSKDAEAAE
jgi:ParB family transcriptional regulator, chromosome partitioning protein